MGNLISTASNYLKAGFSVIPVDKNKIPVGMEYWKPYSDKQMTEAEAKKLFSNAFGIAIIGGKVSGNIEIIDVDLKYDVSGTLGADLYDMIESHLPGLLSKLTIITTKNKGKHIYYRCSTVGGNEKFARRPVTDEEKAKHPKEKYKVLIESKCEGGYVVAPPSDGYLYENGDLWHIHEITTEEREILLSICRSFDQVAPDQPAKAETVKPVSNPGDGITPWKDYDQRGDVLELLSKHGYKIVRTQGEKILLKRPGSTESVYSGNYHTGHKRLRMFSTSTEFDDNHSYSPSEIYALLELGTNHTRIDWKEMRKRLTADGYGSQQPTRNAAISNANDSTGKIEQPQPFTFPYQVFPESIVKVIEETNRTLGFPIDFISSSILAAVSIAIGNACNVKVKNGWTESAALFMAIIGNPGANKSAPQSFAMQPFFTMDQVKFAEYQRQLAEYETERANGNKEAIKPRFTKNITQDFTPEMLNSILTFNPRGVGVVQDEIATWVKNFNRYNKGSEAETWLSIWSNKQISSDRKTSDSYLIPCPFVTVTGGMQPGVLHELAKDGRESNGFLDRILFAYPDGVTKQNWSDLEISQSTIDSYTAFIKRILELPFHVDSNGLPQPVTFYFDEAAKRALYEWQAANTIECNQSSEQIGGLLSKMEIYAVRLSLIVQIMFNESENAKNAKNAITVDSVKAATTLIEYFISTSKKVRNIISGDIISLLNTNKRLLYNKLNTAFSTSDIVNEGELLNIPKRTIMEWLKDSKYFEKIKYGEYKKKY